MITPRERAEEQLLRMEVEAESVDPREKIGHASQPYHLERLTWVRTDRGATKVVGRSIRVRAGHYYGDPPTYHRFLDADWITPPAWATAVITREEALVLLTAHFAQGEAVAA